MSSIRKLGCFDVNDIKLVAFDDADSVVTTELVMNNLIKPMPEATQILMFSTTFSKAALSSIQLPNLVFHLSKKDISPSIKHAFIECYDAPNKFEALVQICKEIHSQSFQAIIFANVRQ